MAWSDLTTDEKLAAVLEENRIQGETLKSLYAYVSHLDDQLARLEKHRHSAVDGDVMVPLSTVAYVRKTFAGNWQEHQ